MHKPIELTYVFEPIIDQCQGCSRIITQTSFEIKPNVYLVPETKYCKSCQVPSAKWKNGPCNLNTHFQRSASGIEFKVDPLKASRQKYKVKK